MIFTCSIDFIFGSWVLLNFALRSDVCFGSLKIDDVNPDVVQLFWTGKDDWAFAYFARAVGWNLASHNQDSVLIVELFTIPRVHLLWHFHLQLREIHLKWRWQSMKNCGIRIYRETMRNWSHWTSCQCHWRPPLSKTLSRKHQNVWSHISLRLC